MKNSNYIEDIRHPSPNAIRNNYLEDMTEGLGTTCSMSNIGVNLSVCL